jgi:hypothetical protein
MRESGRTPPRSFLQRAARVAFAFLVMNASAVAGLVSAIARRKVWR